MASRRIMIRPATRRDCRMLPALWFRAGIRLGSTDNDNALRIRLRRDRDLFLVAVDGGRIVGSLICGWDGWRASMARLAVDPDYRGVGIAARLVQRAERGLRRRGAQRIGALVFADNTLGQRFWRAAGYSVERNITRLVKDL